MKTRLILAVAVLATAHPALAKSKKRAVDAPAAPAVTRANPADAEAGKACTAEADAQGLHADARKAFRKTCMREKLAAAKAAPAIKSAEGAAGTPGGTQR